MKNYPKADIALKRYNFINDSIRRGEEAKITSSCRFRTTEKKTVFDQQQAAFQHELFQKDDLIIILIVAIALIILTTMFIKDRKKRKRNPRIKIRKH